MEPASERGTLSFKARAKINLCLGVLAKRPDGYHEIESVMQSVGLSDEVSLRARRRGVRVACRWDGELTEWSNILGELPPGRGNLAYKAARLVLGQVDAQERSKLGAFISITKRIPVAAGLAGGSTDAASVLVGLNRLWSLGLGTSFLSSLGTRIGADLPFCLQGGTAVARGIGEKIEPLPAGPPFFVIVVKPGFSLNTKDVYRLADELGPGPRPDVPGMVGAILRKDRKGIAERLHNALEEPVSRRHPEVLVWKERLLSAGVLGAAMTGSGPAIFGLVEGEEEAQAVLARMDNHRKDGTAFFAAAMPVSYETVDGGGDLGEAFDACQA